MVLSKNGAWAIMLAFGAFIMISLMLYISVDSNAKRRDSSYKGIITGEDADILQRLKERVENLKNRADDNRQILNKLNAKIGDVVNIAEPLENDVIVEEKEEGQKQQENRKQIPAPLENKLLNFCPSDDIALSHNVTGDVQMLDVYDILPFDNPDGGVWKQGWPIDYDKAKIRQEKRLEVIVVPHSHNDPGWLKTFEGYFEDQTRHILDYMVAHLEKKEDLKFIYAEMSFFELWWAQQNDGTRRKVKKLLDRGQLEIVTGGWVMTDEANSHYYSTIMEMFEGHEFLQNQMDYVPKDHWSIDPFGLSPTLAYILNRANLSHMVIQRVHYSVKKYLAKTKQLEFVWRQLFAGNARNTDIITHMFPFYSYDAPHSCGPDPMVCCQFDFRRMHGQINCPWGKNPMPITNENVAERAELLADQYRKKAQLYGFNTILIPLGDDFRYEINSEWADQYSNYKQLFAYMNAKEDLNIHAQFGTLADYFARLQARLDEAEVEDEKQKAEGKLRHSIVRNHHLAKSALPVLSGDFFTYADRDDHYWSGYFTSRPFYKHMDRSLQHYLRTADIFYTLANWKGQMPTELASMYNNLVDARRAMSLFQHHDGVTGTAKTAVMTDYGQKMAKALSNSKQIIAKCAHFLMNMPNFQGEKGIHVDEEHFVNRLPEKFVVEDGSILVVTNSLGQPRTEVICAHVKDVKSRISSKNGQEIAQQIGPIFFVDLDGNLAHFRDKFELCFLAELPPFGMVRFDIIESEDLSHKVKILASGKFESNAFDVKTIGRDEEAKLSNSKLDVLFDPATGYLKSIRIGNGPNLDVELSFIKYGARQRNPARRDGGDSLSGAYLFLPDGPATELPTYQNSFLLVKGPIRHFLHLKGPPEVDIRHQISLDIDSEFVSLENFVNLGQQNDIDRSNREQNTHLGNYELAMRIRVPSISGDNFFTDLNGFQMIRRRKQAKLPLQAHFYPMPGAAFIEDSHLRVSLLGRQALGAASIESGEMQIMLDRRLIQDDDRGLGQGVEDNLQTESRFRLFIEHFTTANSAPHPNGTIAFHSLAAHHASLALHYPPVLLVGQLDHAASSEVPSTFSGLKRPFPCDVHPVAFRTLSEPTVYQPNSGQSTTTTNSARTSPKREAALVLHRFGLECTLDSGISNLICPSGSMESAGKIDLPTFFHQSPKSIRKGSLTLLHVDDGEMTTIQMDPMELTTVRVEFPSK